jgi:hypothetical protein
MMGSRMEEQITIRLSHDEALVLLDLLGRLDRQSHPLTTHKAEEVALWALECLLEKNVAEVFDPNFSELVAAARGRLAQGYEESDSSHLLREREDEAGVDGEAVHGAGVAQSIFRRGGELRRADAAHPERELVREGARARKLAGREVGGVKAGLPREPFVHRRVGRDFALGAGGHGFRPEQHVVVEQRQFL